MILAPNAWPRRGNKYKNQETEVNGIKFDSKREASRYRLLRLLEIADKISDLRLQERFKLDVNGIHICDYISDFSYQEDGKKVVEDSKGFRTDVYKLKCKLMLAVHGIKIKET